MVRKRSETPDRSCTSCGARNVIEIELTLPDGTEVLFCSCHECESRWWNHEGEPMPLDAVLQLARKNRS
jgi:DNA-directed RNA polymerase subunit M/transcription elongation factor TFIIS